MRTKSLIAMSVVVLFSLPAMAQNAIVLGPHSGFAQACDLALPGGGGQVSLDCFNATAGSASFGADVGPYSLGAFDGTFGPVNAQGVLPAVGSVQVAFSYGPDTVGNKTAGTITLGTMDFTGNLVGTYVPTTVTAIDSAFGATFQVGKTAQATITISTSPGALLTSRFPGKSSATSISGGSITGTSSGMMCKTVTVCTPN